MGRSEEGDAKFVTNCTCRKCEANKESSVEQKVKL